MALLSRRFLTRRKQPRILIAGANFGGLAAARGLSAADYQVTLIDPSPTVEWLPNAHELLSRRKTPAQLTHDRHEVIRRMGHEFIQDAVKTIEPDSKRLTTQEGRVLDYDVLIIAIGNSSRTLGVQGAFEHAITTRTIASCQRINNHLTRLVTLPGERSVVVVGAGAEGIEMLGEILRRFSDQDRLSLHLIEGRATLFDRFPGLHDHLMQRMGGRVTVHCGAKVTEVSSDAVLLEDGSRIPSRLTVWTTGSQGHPLLAEAGLSQPSEDAPVLASLQSQNYPDIFIIGNAARLPRPLKKQAYHAQEMGRHVADLMQNYCATGKAAAFRPSQKPSLISFGDRDALMLFDNKVLTTPSFLGLKEAIYQYAYHELMPPRSPRELSSLVKDFRHGISTLDTWRILSGSTEARLFQAR
ncbi:MAG: FAD-dependent oxidoreductase [Moraxellaceae bacterium]|nr:FAD-dependent oxidoreductase [Moraxellaceae bacterium]HQV41636.1 FAD-dependent oxidoreductase [Moraxellaceae bacterium]